MPKKIRELKQALKKAGFVCKRTRGSHERWIHPQLPELPITLAGKNSQDAKRYLEKLVSTAVEKAKNSEVDE
ncbi:MAG: type II toxin-antitoxin system HicA family toxin [Cyanobacteria bacterium J06627_28]